MDNAELTEVEKVRLYRAFQYWRYHATGWINFNDEENDLIEQKLLAFPTIEQ